MMLKNIYIIIDVAEELLYGCLWCRKSDVWLSKILNNFYIIIDDAEELLYDYR
jgi:hypothetical protein